MSNRAGNKRPQTWKYPFDEGKSKKHMGFLRARAQCRFRNEAWTITEDEWQTLWKDHLWSNRGRLALNYCMIREDNTSAWSMDNVMIVTRRVQLIIQKYEPELVELEPGVWDITGEALIKWQRNQKWVEKYRGRYDKPKQPRKNAKQ